MARNPPHQEPQRFDLVRDFKNQELQCFDVVLDLTIENLNGFEEGRFSSHQEPNREAPDEIEWRQELKTSADDGDPPAPEASPMASPFAHDPPVRGDGSGQLEAGGER